MKNGSLYITEAEMRLMEVLWREDRLVCGSELNRLLAVTGWKRATMYSLCMRLAEKGFIQYLKTDDGNYYFAVITQFDYRFMMTKSLLNGVHGGSAAELVKTLLCDWDLEEEDLDALKTLVGNAVLAKALWKNNPQSMAKSDEGQNDEWRADNTKSACEMPEENDRNSEDAAASAEAEGCLMDENTSWLYGYSTWFLFLSAGEACRYGERCGHAFLARSGVT